MASQRGSRASAWLIGFSIFVFTSLAFAKRFVELRELASDWLGGEEPRLPTPRFPPLVGAMGTASAFVSALVFVL